MKRSEKQARGFTLLELLIVISVLAILSVALILVLNPAESMKKSRDTQRMSDLSTLKTAIGLYLTNASSPDLDAAVGGCFDSGGASAKIFYSANLANQTCPLDISEGLDADGDFDSADFCTYTSASGAVDGTGWLPINLTQIPGGSPISNLPIDPSNTVASGIAPKSTDLVYRYVCQNVSTASGLPSSVFEINAQLESDAFTVSDDRRTKDGGDNNNYYEVGTSLKLMGAGTNF